MIYGAGKRDAAFFSKMTTEELGIVFPFRISSARKYVILYPVHTNLFSMFKSGLTKQG